MRLEWAELEMYFARHVALWHGALFNWKHRRARVAI